MSFSFNQSLEKVNLSGIKSRINYRIMTAGILTLIAVPLLLLSSCSNKNADQAIIHVNNQIDPTLVTTATMPVTMPYGTHPVVAPYPINNTQHYPPQYQTGLREINSVDYYSKNYYFVNDRIKLSKKVAIFIKNPPLKSNPRMYKRFHSVKADFYKVRKYRIKLDDMVTNHKGRNNLLSNVEKKRQHFFEMEAELFYQLEKMVYFAEQSYLEWQIFKSTNAIQLSRFEKNSIHRSEMTANLFEDFSYAVTNYTGVSR